MQSALGAAGQRYREFLITKFLPLPELRSDLIELVHEPTGARIMHIANSDPENVFCLSFQTLPSSSNGVAHILEHTVLCGSKKFPVKDPFFAMMRRSLNTFMNAFTGQDFTCYPASSQVKKDFYNLLEVYLDAVFHPELKKMSFLQEGHRLEFSDPENSDSTLKYQGVVFNEMKGAMMGSESRLWQALAKRLVSDLPYSFNSGGDPKEIPNLSHEELIEFHRSFYHPSRCLFYFYGDIPLAEHLAFLEKHALQGVGKLALLPPLPLQSRLQGPLHVEESYPIAESESPKSKTEIAFSWLTAHLAQQSDVLALCLAEIFLMETDVSPLKLALLKSGYCREAESSIDVEMSEVPLTLICKGCEPEHLPKLQSVIFKTLESVVSKPLDEERIQAALHQLEFQRTEIGGDGVPFGLSLFLRAGLIKQHGNEPEGALLIQSLFHELADRLKNPAYLPGIIRRYLIDNTHLVSLVLRPDPELEKKERAEEENKLHAVQRHLSQKQKEAILEQTKQLRAYQEAAEHQSLDCLPKIELADIPKRARDYPLAHFEKENFDLFHHECFTNQIIYADLVFDLPEIAEADLPLLSVLAKLWTELGCKGRTYEETLQAIESHSGGIDGHLALHVSTRDPNVLKPTFSLRGKALGRKAEPFFKLLADLSMGPTFSERERIEEWLLQHVTELDEAAASNPLSYAIQLSLAGYSTASFVYNQWNGLPYYAFVKKLASGKSGDWIGRLEPLAKQILRCGKPHLVLGCEKKQLDELFKHNFYALGDRPATPIHAPWKGGYAPEAVPSQARLISSPVSFTALGMRTASYRDPYAAELMLSTELLDNVILHKEVREKGGAYGSGATYTPTTGNYHLYSFRDPHLAQTIETFHRSIESLAQGAFNERELEEAKIALIGSIDTPIPPGGRAIAGYAWHRAERTLAERQHLRDQILGATKSQVVEAISKNLLHRPATLISILGKELWKKEEAKLSQPLQVSPL